MVVDWGHQIGLQGPWRRMPFRRPICPEFTHDVMQSRCAVGVVPGPSGVMRLQYDIVLRLVIYLLLLPSRSRLLSAGANPATPYVRWMQRSQ